MAQTIQQAKKMHGHREASDSSPRSRRGRAAIDVETARAASCMSPTNRADAGNKPNQFREEDEDEDRGEEPEGLLHQRASR